MPPPAYYAHLAAFRGRLMVSEKDESASEISGVSAAPSYDSINLQVCKVTVICWDVGMDCWIEAAYMHAGEDIWHADCGCIEAGSVTFLCTLNVRALASCHGLSCCTAPRSPSSDYPLSWPMFFAHLVVPLLLLPMQLVSTMFYV